MNRARQSGVALLTVLLMVMVISVLVIAVLDDIRFGQRRSANSQALEQARWQALAGEAVAGRQLDRLYRASPTRTTLDGDWAGRPVRLPLPGGSVQLVLDDATHCFNLNSVVQGANDLVTRRDSGVAQFIALARTRGIGEPEARMLADALVDWIDSDQQPGPGGQEDAGYRRGRDGYLTGATLLAEASELRAVRGFTPQAYAALRPWVCALPDNAPSPVNVNTLRPDQAPLLEMLTRGRLGAQAARGVIANRPAGGWADAAAFWAQPALAATAPDNETLGQAAARTRWFRLQARVEHGPARVVLESLLEQAGDGQVRLRQRQWNLPE